MYVIERRLQGVKIHYHNFIGISCMSCADLLFPIYLYKALPTDHCNIHTLLNGLFCWGLFFLSTPTPISSTGVLKSGSVIKTVLMLS